MTKPTDREAVERLASALEETATVHDAMNRAFMSLECTLSAATLRALLAERDHAEAKEQAAVKEMREAAWSKVHWRSHAAEQIRSLPAPTDALDRAMEAAAERAFKDGIAYATICEVGDPDEAWRTSACRAEIVKRAV